MELNGIANIIMAIDSADDSSIDSELRTAILEQCDIMERYFLTYAETMEDKVQAASNGMDPNEYLYTPWHEVRDNRAQFLNMRERIRAQRNGDKDE